jgi:hypothetical protein
VTDLTAPAKVFTVRSATGAEPAKARALLEELAGAYTDIDAAVRLLEVDDSWNLEGRCVYVIVRDRGADSLDFLRSCLSEQDPEWSKLVYIVGDPALRTAPLIEIQQRCVSSPPG